MKIIRFLSIASLCALAGAGQAQMYDGCTREFDGRMYAVTRYVYWPTAQTDYCGKPEAAPSPAAKKSRAARPKARHESVEK